MQRLTGIAPDNAALASAVADVLIDNEGPREDLERQVDRIWSDLAERATAG